MSDLLDYFRHISDVFWGNDIFHWWFYISIVIILILEKNTAAKWFFGAFSILFLIGICNPIAYNIMQFVAPEWQYYTRLFTTLPVPYTIAYGSVLLIKYIRIPRKASVKQLDIKEKYVWIGKNKGIVSILLIIIICIIIIMGGTDVYNLDWMQPSKNLEMVPNDAIEITKLLHKDEGVTIAVPESLSSYIRQLDASFFMPYGRYMNELGSEISKENPDPEYVMREAGKSGCDYIVVYNNQRNIEELNRKGWRERQIVGEYIVLPVEGVERIKKKYNTKHQLIETVQINASGDVIPYSQGYTFVRYAYDDFGNRIKEAYFDENNNPFVLEDGYSEIRKTYTLISHQIASIKYFRDGIPTFVNGICETRYTYYFGSRMIATETYFGTEGERITNPNGNFSSKEYAYDKQGNVTEEKYYNTEDTLCESAYGYAMVRRNYDEKGRKINEKYYDHNGNMKVLDLGYAGAKWDYIDENNKIIITYLNEKDLPITLSLGFSGVERSLDERKYIISEKYLDSERNEIATIYGYSRIEWKYDSKGNKTEERYYLNTEPFKLSHGYCSILREYDDNRRVIDEVYLDEQDIKACREFGYAEIKREYINNRLVKEEYYDKNGKLVNNIWGYSYVTWKYDNESNKIEESYWDKNGILSDTTMGYAKIIRQYGSDGELLLEKYFDSSGIE